MTQPDSVFQQFCAAGLWPGLGPVLTDAFAKADITGPDQITADRLEELPGVGKVRAGRLLSAWIGAEPTYEVASMLVASALPIRWAARIADVYEDPAGALREDPWLLLELTEASLAEADRFAVTTVPGISRRDPRRGRALVAYTLGRTAREGHTVAPVEAVGSALAAAQVDDPRTAVTEACRRGVVAGTLRGQPVLGLERYMNAEERCAQALARLITAGEPFELDNDVVDADADLDDTQRRAVGTALQQGVSVLTGGPGTGKSRTVGAVVRLAEKAGQRVLLAAPTGRAAKRLEELIGAPGATVHRLLGAAPRHEQRPGEPMRFEHGPGNPLEADLIVVDETSMLDVELAAALVDACADGTHLLLVGDPAQLPSIGPGRVLADIVESAAVPVTELTTLYRQSEGGAIARLATSVRSGELPPIDSPDREVVVVPTRGSSEAAHRVAQLVTDSIPRALGIAPGAIQVVTPVHRGPAGTAALNRELKAVLNPGKGAVRGFDVGDRVVATANHLDASPTGFANGEVGVVSEARGGSVTVEFATGPAVLRGKTLGDLLHGWAITVHRAQGSEWPAVVACLPPESGRLLSRPLVYTAITRAQQHLSIVHATGPALAHAVRRIGAAPRSTRLRELLTSAAPE